MQIQGFGETDVGRKRGHNEDFLLVRPQLGLYLVCDGMGGHAAGEVASEKAARAVETALEDEQAVLDRFREDPDDRGALLALVRGAVEDASRQVFALATSEEGRAGMGTTLTLLLVLGNKGVMAHVGDSRLYLLRNEEVHQLSEDHSYVTEMIKRGMITKDKAKDSPYANMITRAVGIQSSVQVDTLTFDILPGDTYLLCSDGLSGYFDDEHELAQVLANDSVSSLPGQLIDIANDRGGKDNITAIVLRATRDEDPAGVDEVRSTQVNLQLETLRYISLFKHLTMKELVKVLEVFRPVRYAPGEEVIREGETGNSLYIIVEGTCAVERGGKEIARLEGGTHFGEMALLSARPRSATVRPITEARLLVMDQPRLHELIRQESVLGVKFLWTFAQVLSLRLDEATEATPDPPPFK